MSRATPAQLALSAAGCLSALADTLRSERRSHPAYLEVERFDRSAAREALHRFWFAVEEHRIEGLGLMCATIRLEKSGPTLVEIDGMAEALRAWAREHEDPSEPSREERIDAAVHALLPFRDSRETINMIEGRVGSVLAVSEITASLARLGAVDRDGRWTLPQPPGSAAAPEATAAPPPPQKPASVAAEGGTVGERVARSWFGDAGGPDVAHMPDLARRIDAAVAEAVAKERATSASVGAMMRAEIGRISTQRDEQAALAAAWQKTAEEAIARAEKAQGDRDFAAGEWGKVGTERDAAVARADEATRKLAASDALIAQIEALAKKYGAYK